MQQRRLRWAVLGLALAFVSSVARAQSNPVKGSASATLGVQTAGVEGPEEANLAAVPQMSREQVAALPAAPPLRTGFTPEQYAAAKAAAMVASNAQGSGNGQSAMPSMPGGGPGQTPSASAGFFGIKEGCGGTLVPPDMGLAVNQSFVVEAVNACVAIYSKSGVLQAGFPKNLNAFFGLGAANFLFDPRAIYDWVNNRWILVVADCRFCSTGSQMGLGIVAVSQTSDPRGAWFVYKISPALLSTGDLFDFPQLGQDRKAVYLSFNHFGAVNFIDAHVLILPKSKLYSGTSLGSISFFFNFNAGGFTLDTIQPANEFSPSDHPRAEFLMNSFNIHFGGGQCFSSSCNGLVVWAISNPIAGPEASGVIVGTANNYSFPPNASQSGCGSSNCMPDTNDVRISGSVPYHAGSLFGSLNTASGAPGPHILWFEVKPHLTDTGSCATSACPHVNGATIVNEDCYFCGFSGGWFFGTLQPDLENNVTMVFNYSDSSHFPGTAYVSRRATQAPNSMHDNGIFLTSGAAFYNQFPARWGDYTDAAPDLTTAGSRIWFAGEFSNGVGRWGTVIGANGFNLVTDP
jgi:hypothetical protein